MRGSIRAFTLIELMIGIAILAIFLAVPFGALQSSNSLNRESDYRWALANARTQKSRLQQTDFEKLPPQRLRVAADGTVSVDQEDIIDGSITVNGKTLNETLHHGRLLVGKEFAGKTVTVNYRFSLSEQNEAHFLDAQRTVRLENAPLVRVEKVWLVRGDTLSPIAPSNVDLKSGTLSFTNLPEGALVLADYHGKRWRNQVTGRFLDGSLKETLKPTDTKLLEVGEEYGGAWRMSLPLIKVRVP